MSDQMYHHGMGSRIAHNIIVSGESDDNKIKVSFGQPLVFQEGTLKLAKGFVKLKGHSISGRVTMSVKYANSRTTPDDDRTEAGQDGGRTERATTGEAKGVYGSASKGTSSSEIITAINAALNAR